MKTTTSKVGHIHRPISRPMLWCAAAILLYIIFILTLAPNTETMRLYHLSQFEYRAMMLAVAIPSMVVWLAAFVGYGALQKFAYAIRKTPEGPYYQQLVAGSSWLIWSLPIPVILSLLLNAIATKHPDFHTTAIILINYVSLLLPLIAFTLIYHGGRTILPRQGSLWPNRGARALLIVFIICCAIYCWLTSKQLDMQHLANSDNLYFLPGWIVIMTILIPYLYVWFIGLTSTYRLALYGRNTAGLLYRRALIYLVIGFSAVIFSSIALQYVNIVIPRVGHLVLDYRFFAVTIFRIIGAAGFVALAIGASRLRKIEEV